MNTWKSLKIDGKFYIVRIDHRPDDTVTLWLSDFRVIYKEQLSLTQLQERSMNVNPIIEFEPHTVLDTILNEDAQHTQFVPEGDLVWLKCKYYVSQMPYHFSWKLTPQNANVFYDMVTTSLLSSVLVCQLQRTQLLDTIIAKDAEIEQYKLNGAELTRKHLATVSFDREAFEESYATSDNLGNIVQQECEALGLNFGSCKAETKPTPTAFIRIAEQQAAAKKRLSASPTKPSKRMTKEMLARSKFHSGQNVSMVYGDEDDDVEEIPSTANSGETNRVQKNSTNVPRIKTKLNL